MLVKGGPANSGSKRKLREPRKVPWYCRCPELQKRYISRCNRCRMNRPAGAGPS